MLFDFGTLLHTPSALSYQQAIGPVTLNNACTRYSKFSSFITSKTIQRLLSFCISHRPLETIVLCVLLILGTQLRCSSVGSYDRRNRLRLYSHSDSKVCIP